MPTAAQAAMMGGGGGFGAMFQSSATGASATRSLQTTDITQLMPASPVYADTALSGFEAYREIEAEPRRSTERLTPLEEAQGLTATSAERTSSGLLATDRLEPLNGADALSGGGTMSSMSSGCTGPTDETIYNIYNAAGQLVLVDKAHLCQMTLYIQGAGQTVTRIEVDTAASTLTRTYLHPDHLGSAAAGTSQSGTVLWREQYTPYGEKLTAPAANDNQGGFTGHIDDVDTGLNYMQARYYDPSLARFLSIDPVGFLETGSPSMFNRYAYSVNDPVNNTDPSGECVPGLCPADIAMSAAAIKQDAGSFGVGVARGVGASFASTATLGQMTSPSGMMQVLSGNSASNQYAAAIGPAENVSMAIGDMQGENLGNAAQAVGGPAGAAKGVAVATSARVVKSLGANPFKGLKPQQIADKLTAKGFIPKGPNPTGGQGTFVSPKGRPVHIDASHPAPKGPHVGVQRPRGARSNNLPKARDYDLD